MLGHNKTVHSSRFAVRCSRLAVRGNNGVYRPTSWIYRPVDASGVRSDRLNGRWPTVNGVLGTANGELLGGKTLGKFVPQELRDMASQNLVTVGTEMDLIVLEKGEVRLFIRAKQIGI